MATLAEMMAAQRAQAAPTPAPAPTAPAPSGRVVADATPSNFRPPGVNDDERRLGFTDGGEQIAMAWPANADGKAWEAARHGLASELVIYLHEGRAWLSCLRAGHEPIHIAGPFKTITAPF